MNVHNELLSAWVQAVDDEVMPRLEKAIVRLSPEAIERLRLRIASNLMRSGRVVKLMEKMEAYLQLYVFRIPDTVTLREDQIQLEPRKPNPFDLLEETDDMQKEIIQLRAVLEIRRRQRRNVDAAIAIHRGILEMMKDTPIDKEENDEPMDGE